MPMKYNSDLLFVPLPDKTKYPLYLKPSGFVTSDLLWGHLNENATIHEGRDSFLSSNSSNKNSAPVNKKSSPPSRKSSSFVPDLELYLLNVC
jgi:hypothetical protein